MATTQLPTDMEVFIGFGLFFLSELIGISKYRQNSVLQLVLTIARRAFPYELKRLPANDGGYQENHDDANLPERIYTDEDLDDMNVADLRAIARSFGKINLANKGRRDELVNYIRRLKR